MKSGKFSVVSWLYVFASNRRATSDASVHCMRGGAGAPVVTPAFFVSRVLGPAYFSSVTRAAVFRCDTPEVFPGAVLVQ